MKTAVYGQFTNLKFNFPGAILSPLLPLSLSPTLHSLLQVSDICPERISLIKVARLITFPEPFLSLSGAAVSK